MDRVEVNQVTGWAGNAAGKALWVHVYDSETYLLSSPANSVRRDDAAPLCGNNPYVGFSVALPPLAPGDHSIRVYESLRSTPGTENRLPGPSVLHIPDAEFTGPSPFGVIEYISAQRVEGWACDVDAGPKPVVLDVFVQYDGRGPVRRIASGKTGIPRSIPACGLNTRPGFRIALPKLRGGRHNIAVKAKNVGAGQHRFLEKYDTLATTAFPYADSVNLDPNFILAAGAWSTECAPGCMPIPVVYDDRSLLPPGSDAIWVLSFDGSAIVPTIPAPQKGWEDCTTRVCYDRIPSGGMIFSANTTFLDPAYSTALAFATNDIVDLRALATSHLTAPSRPIDTWLLAQLSTDTRVALEHYVDVENSTLEETSALRDALVRDLNTLLDGPSIYGHTRFVGIKKRCETEALLRENPSGKALRRLNRLLLEDAYPTSLAWKAYLTAWNYNFQAMKTRTLDPLIPLASVSEVEMEARLAVREEPFIYDPSITDPCGWAECGPEPFLHVIVASVFGEGTPGSPTYFIELVPFLREGAAMPPGCGVRSIGGDHMQRVARLDLQDGRVAQHVSSPSTMLRGEERLLKVNLKSLFHSVFPDVDVSNIKLAGGYIGTEQYGPTLITLDLLRLSFQPMANP